MEKFEYRVIESLPDESVLQQVHQLYQLLFDRNDTQKIHQRLLDKSFVLVVLAYDQNSLIGFKIGYQLEQSIFYSWLGGVHQGYRRKGVAKELALLQENTIREKGYRTLRTKSKNQFKPMMIFNLKNGFDIIGTEKGSDGNTKIIFEKTL